MNPKVREYIDRKMEEVNKNRNKERDKFLKEREKFLIREGLYEKVYLEENALNDEYYYSEPDPVTQDTKYYKKVAIDVTDEEFEEIKRVCDVTSSDKKTEEENSIAGFVKSIGILLYIVGALASLIIGSEYESLMIALLCFIATFINGTSFLGFAEIIQLLNEIKNKD